MKDLLICIAFHYKEDRLHLLDAVISNIVATYKCSIDIIIDTNEILDDWNQPNVIVLQHKKLDHPFHLTWKHRKHFLDAIDKYKNFMYIEDDIIVPYKNYVNYLENFKLVYPAYVPSFIRIELKGEDYYVTDVTEPQTLDKININEKDFVSLNQPYHAFWIMPQKELKESISRAFYKPTDCRECAASYIMGELKKAPLVELEGDEINELCYSYHIANNYVMADGIPFAKLKPNQIFIK